MALMLRNLKSSISSLWNVSNIMHMKTNIGGCNVEQIRTYVRKHFPRPSERKRISKHGYEKRLSTPGGRAVLMRRILKGRFVLSH
ncbi:39S ribosomal protein L34, mitochondrial [Caerostris extrusa]|uniref:Large ribosomal subunit protein bL34m n=1 Tax=Caerostris extrusa TaxID=172846 RepID=A0AAV4PN55_CAEEX|nr:39S ribosomal protein L34, mitochondrial [Caerostris extrusa]